jgi:surfeit locus 1 family protein
MRTRLTAAAMTLLTLALCVLFVRLGLWQWHRWQAADAAWTRFTRGADVLEPLGTRGLSEVARFQRVSLTGTLDGAHQFLLDNRSYRGSPGYEVLTPLRRADGRMLLVDRGWVAFTGSRSHLPDVRLAEPAAVVLTGRIADLPSAGLASGRAAPAARDPWPRVTSFPTLAELSASLGAPLEPRILWLDPGAPFGFVRDWQPPGLPPLRHLSYAVQWWCFAALALALWALFAVRRARGLRTRSSP